MPQILYVNPQPLKGARTMAKKRRTAKQKAATKRMQAANRARAGRRSAAPKRRRARRKSNPVTPLRNPTRRRARRATAAVRTRRRARRSNPSMPGFVRDAMNALVPSAIGGAGALGVDVAMAVLPLPAMFTTGPAKPVARIAAAVAVGALAGMAVNRRVGSQVMAGGITVVMYDTIKAFAARVLGGKVPGVGVYDVPGIGVYDLGHQMAPMLPAPDGSMGYAESAMQFPDQVGEYVG
jgi:hypothetical protein